MSSSRLHNTPAPVGRGTVHPAGGGQLSIDPSADNEKSTMYGSVTSSLTAFNTSTAAVQNAA
ncbi:hypothetical protein A0H81_00390 [Grifola frondosa]|uniref:Uncharacterized protein n=1 Tax=Grifola frondosa TaxID=5627 RepID=A0A1C7MTJ1_GRIFR|nr:hypothetical protein A0H81_00390 [Grifola frondosa]